MADVKQDVRAIAKFLGLNSVKVNVNSETKTPVLHTENSKSVEGLSSITVYLAKKCNNRKILGETAEQYAVVSQWSEYRVTQIDRCKNKEDICTVLKELNSYLVDRVYIVGCHFTAADLLLYYGLHSIVSDLTVQEKQKYTNLSRWFDNVQRYPNIKQNFSHLTFPKNLL